MGSVFRNKGITVTLTVAVASTAIFLAYQSGHMGGSEKTKPSNSTSIENSKSFEVLEPATTVNTDLSGKTAEELMLEADQLILSTNKLLEDIELPQAELSVEQKQEIDESVARLQEEIKALEQQLK